MEQQSTFSVFWNRMMMVMMMMMIVVIQLNSYLFARELNSPEANYKVSTGK
jgi:hypothetical protein